MRVATVRFGAPRSQAAGCLVRLQLPRSPSTRTGGGLWPSPGMGTKKSGMTLSSGGKSSSSLNSSTPGRVPAPPPGGGAVLARVCRPSWVPSNRTHPATCRPPWPALRSPGAGSRALRRNPPGGGSAELPGTSGTRPDPGWGPIPQSANGLVWSMAWRAGSPADAGAPPWPVCSAATPGTSQRWMWPLGSPEGPGSLLGLRARWSADPHGAFLPLGCAGFPFLLTLGGAPFRAAWDACCGS